MSNQFERVPTCGENDVDLRVATEPRRAADRLTASVQFHELAQGYRAATPDGAQGAYEKLCAYLEGRATGVDRNSVLDEVADQVAQFDKRATPKGIAVAIRCMKSAAPQPVDAAQAVPEGWKMVPIKPTAKMLIAGAESEDKDFGLVIHDCYCAMLDAAPAAQPTDTTKGA